MRKIFILPLITLSLLSFADSEAPTEVVVEGVREPTPSSGFITTLIQTSPPAGGFRGGPGAETVAAEKAGKCAAVPQIIKYAGEEYSKCATKADSQATSDRAVCSSSSLKTTTKGLTLTNVGTVGYSKVSVEGMTPKECTDLVEKGYDNRIKDICKADYEHTKDYANALKEANCPK